MCMRRASARIALNSAGVGVHVAAFGVEQGGVEGVVLDSAEGGGGDAGDERVGEGVVVGGGQDHGLGRERGADDGQAAADAEGDVDDDRG